MFAFDLSADRNSRYFIKNVRQKSRQAKQSEICNSCWFCKAFNRFYWCITSMPVLSVKMLLFMQGCPEKNVNAIERTWTQFTCTVEIMTSHTVLFVLSVKNQTRPIVLTNRLFVCHFIKHWNKANNVQIT